jgi:ribonuclease E
VRTRAEVAIYVLNHKRAHLRSLEERFRVTLTVTTDPSIAGQVSFAVDRGEQMHTVEAAKALLASQPASSMQAPEEEEEEEDETDLEADETEVQAEAQGEESAEPAEGARDEGGPRRKRRRRRRGGGGKAPEASREAAGSAGDGPMREQEESDRSEEQAGGEDQQAYAGTARGEPGPSENGRPRNEGEPRRRRRGRRGGRRNRRDREGGDQLPGNDNGGGQSYTATPDIAEATRVPRIEPSAVGRETNQPPAYEPRAYEPRAYEPPAIPSPAPSQPAARMEPEPPKRRSTIREPAPTFTSGQGFSPPPRAEPMAPSAPVASDEPQSQSDEAGKPRKTGWWAKRIMGDKG